MCKSSRAIKFYCLLCSNGFPTVSRSRTTLQFINNSSHPGWRGMEINRAPSQRKGLTEDTCPPVIVWCLCQVIDRNSGKHEAWTCFSHTRPRLCTEIPYPMQPWPQSEQPWWAYKAGIWQPTRVSQTMSMSSRLDSQHRRLRVWWSKSYKAWEHIISPVRT
jgi:hypothetical protein